MLVESSHLSHPEAPARRTDASRGPPAPPAGRENRILAALPHGDVERLLPHLEPVPLAPGQVLHGAGQRRRHLFFLTEGIVARIYETEAGASAAFAFTGNEGAVGVASFLGGESMPSRAVVISPGFAHRLDECLLQSEFAHDGPLPHALLRYTRSLFTQAGQIAVCNRRHSLEQQFCRLMLSCLDRLPSNELTMTQELISSLLGVRRESVTDVAGKLQRAGHIHYHRGHISALDRAGLEAHACECYRAVKLDFDRLLCRGPVAGSLDRQ
jgi:CRP-like cAMP-binding protein